jgi:hypothetical protein
MKATLTFTLPHEAEEFAAATGATAVLTELEGFRNWLRDLRKHGDHSTTTGTEAIDSVWDVFHEYLGDHLS